MRRLLQLVVATPVALTFGLIFLAGMGVYSAWHMPVDLFPDLDVPVVNITTQYPGAAAEDVELLISRPMEAEMRTILGVKRVASTSIQGVSQITVAFSWGTSVGDARQAVQSKLSRLNAILPPAVRPRVDNIGTTLQEVAGYVVYGGTDLVTLNNTVRHDLASRLMGVDGVSLVDVLGGDQRAFTVHVQAETLAKFGLSIRDITSLLKANNVIAVAGYVERGSREYFIRGDARLRTIEDIRGLPVTTATGESIVLGSIMKVEQERVPRHYQIQGDGVPSVAFLVRKQPGASTLRVVRDVDAAVAELHVLFPAKTDIKKFYDQSEIISEARDSILQDLLLGSLLAGLVLYFFLGSLRPTLIVVVTVPITLLATAAVMRCFGLGWNIVTMTALTLAIGMIVDDAIVVVENIHRHRLAGSSQANASLDGALEIAAADASGTITTVAAFLPLVMVTGLAGLFLKPFGLTISAALLVSLVLSLTLVPALSSRSVARRSDTVFLGSRVLALLNQWLQNILTHALRHKGRTVLLSVLFLCLGGLSALIGSIHILPPIDEGAIVIEYVMPPGVALSESGRIGDTLDRIALADPAVSCVYRRTGAAQGGYQIEGVNVGELLIKLKPKGERRRNVAEIIAHFRNAYSTIGGTVLLYRQPTQEKIEESFTGLPAVFGVTVYGANMDTLTSLAGEVEQVLLAEPDVDNVVNNTKIKASELRVRVNYEKLASYDVRAEDVLATLRASQFGIEATRIIRQREDVVVMVKMDDQASGELEQIRHTPIANVRGELVPLERVAEVQVVRVHPFITRLNGQRQITLLAEVEGNIPLVVQRLRRKFKQLRVPTGYTIDFTGQYKVLIETAIELAIVLLSAVVLIYLIMVMQFHSWWQPLIVLLTIPLCLVGALIALFVTRQGLDVSVGMGAVTLVGIAVNNSIVLLDYANKRAVSEQGIEQGIEQALLAAASVRLCPILLTSLTTVFALLPVAIGSAAGSEMFRPFAITVIGGLLAGIPATLVLVPTLVAATGRRRASSTI